MGGGFGERNTQGIEVERWGGEQAHLWVGSLKSLQDLSTTKSSLDLLPLLFCLQMLKEATALWMPLPRNAPDSSSFVSQRSPPEPGTLHFLVERLSGTLALSMQNYRNETPALNQFTSHIIEGGNGHERTDKMGTDDTMESV